MPALLFKSEIAVRKGGRGGYWGGEVTDVLHQRLNHESMPRPSTSPFEFVAGGGHRAIMA